jgi:hypothetical protein
MRRRLKHVAKQDQRLLREERIDDRGRRIGQQRHVGFVDRLPTGDRRPVEHRAGLEQILVDQRQVERHVLPLTPRVREAQVDELDLFVLDLLKDGICVSHQSSP